MNRLDRLFQRKTADLLNVYFTAGYPERDDTVPVLRALERAGVDLVEIGMPYSDPLADGPTIQESGSRAIANGMTLPLLFEQIRTFRSDSDLPLILMGYFNQVMQFGDDRFIDTCRDVGVDGVILPDLPLHEYETSYRQKFEAAGLHFSFLITPQTEPDRIRRVDELTRGFIYMVSSSSITGKSGDISPEQLAYFERIAAMQLKNPRLIGFGISDRRSYETAARYANGAIIGSAFIRALRDGSPDVETATEAFVRRIRD